MGCATSSPFLSQGRRTFLAVVDQKSSTVPSIPFYVSPSYVGFSDSRVMGTNENKIATVTQLPPQASDKLSGAKLIAKYFPWRRTNAMWMYIPGRNKYVKIKQVLKRSTTSLAPYYALYELRPWRGQKQQQGLRPSLVPQTTEQAKDSNPGGYKIHWKKYGYNAPHSLGQDYLGQKSQRLERLLGSRFITEGKYKQASCSEWGVGGCWWRQN